MITKLVFFASLSVSFCTALQYDLKFNGTSFKIHYNRDDGFDFWIFRDAIEIYRGTSDELLGPYPKLKILPNGISFGSDTGKVYFLAKERSNNFTEWKVIHRSYNKTITDCSELSTGNTFWYGGLEQSGQQYFPINSQLYDNLPYVTQDGNAVAERYWLNSKGVYIYVGPRVPLFLSMVNDKICFTSKKETPYHNDGHLVYYIGVANETRHAHMAAIRKHLGKPSRSPDFRMAQQPIWSTWARYKAAVNDSTVRKFTAEILEHNFTGSQIEIDDFWEKCYGSLSVSNDKFPNMRKLVTDIHKVGFRVTLWVHPFINRDCEPWFTYAKSAGYFVTNSTGHIETQWWNSGPYEAGVLDFTNKRAREWFVKRLKKLQRDNGFDGFKFDAGETSWAPADPMVREQNFEALTTHYIRTVAKEFGNITEVRSGWRNQKEGIYMRMLDRESTFDLEGNGLASVVTTLLQLNLAGYPFVLPDMVGGNGYHGAPDDELFIRWLQANVFMPSIQFSYVPWDYSQRIVEWSKTMVDLHIKYAHIIHEAMKNATSHGVPVNPPVWWLDPTDDIALGIGDQFLLGDRILVAPILIKYTRSRNIYLPQGRWRDGNNKSSIIKGPAWIKNYYAPLNVLPYFVKK